MKMLEELQFCSSRNLSPYQEESSDEELSVLPRHTKVVVTGNNRTKSVLVGLQGVVKKAVGLGGWHWLVLKNGIEVKLQRNALSVLEHPAGNEDDDRDFDHSSGSEACRKDGEFPSVSFRKMSKPRVSYTRPWISSVSDKSLGQRSYRDVHSFMKRPQSGESGEARNKFIIKILQLLPPCNSQSQSRKIADAPRRVASFRVAEGERGRGDHGLRSGHQQDEDE